MVVVLPSGRYPVLVSDLDGETGVGLVEVYQMEP